MRGDYDFSRLQEDEDLILPRPKIILQPLELLPRHILRNSLRRETEISSLQSLPADFIIAKSFNLNCRFGTKEE